MVLRNGYKIIPGVYIEIPAIDCEGTLRPQDGDTDGISKCDMGAYEYYNNKTNITSNKSSSKDSSSEICFISVIGLY